MMHVDMQHISQQHQVLKNLNTDLKFCDITETQTDVRCEHQWFDGSLTT